MPAALSGEGGKGNPALMSPLPAREGADVGARVRAPKRLRRSPAAARYARDPPPSPSLAGRGAKCCRRLGWLVRGMAPPQTKRGRPPPDGRPRTGPVDGRTAAPPSFLGNQTDLRHAARFLSCASLSLRLASFLRATKAAAAAPNSRTIGGAGTSVGGVPPEELPPVDPPLDVELLVEEEVEDDPPVEVDEPPLLPVEPPLLPVDPPKLDDPPEEEDELDEEDELLEPPLLLLDPPLPPELPVEPPKLDDPPKLDEPPDEEPPDELLLDDEPPLEEELPPLPPLDELLPPEPPLLPVDPPEPPWLDEPP